MKVHQGGWIENKISNHDGPWKSARSIIELRPDYHDEIVKI